jgi:hypothetical protein
MRVLAGQRSRSGEELGFGCLEQEHWTEAGVRMEDEVRKVYSKWKPEGLGLVELTSQPNLIILVGCPTGVLWMG